MSSGLRSNPLVYILGVGSCWLIFMWFMSTPPFPIPSSSQYNNDCIPVACTTTPTLSSSTLTELTFGKSDEQIQRDQLQKRILDSETLWKDSVRRREEFYQEKGGIENVVLQVFILFILHSNSHSRSRQVRR